MVGKDFILQNKHYRIYRVMDNANFFKVFKYIFIVDGVWIFVINCPYRIGIADP